MRSLIPTDDTVFTGSFLFDEKVSSNSFYMRENSPSGKPIYTTNSIQTTLLRRFIRVGQTDKMSDTNLILQTITIRLGRRSIDAFQTNLISTELFSSVKRRRN